MRKIFLILYIMIMTLCVNACSSNESPEGNSKKISDNSVKKTTSSLTDEVKKISENDAIDIILEKMSKEDKHCITDLDNPRVEKTVIKTETGIMKYDKSYDLMNKEVYKVVFHTNDEALLGTMDYYVDTSTGILYGVGFRE